MTESSPPAGSIGADFVPPMYPDQITGSLNQGCVSTL